MSLAGRTIERAARVRLPRRPERRLDLVEAIGRGSSHAPGHLDCGRVTAQRETERLDGPSIGHDGHRRILFGKEFQRGARGTERYPAQFYCDAVTVAGDENDPVYGSQVSAFIQSLAGLGWADGRNMRMDLRWYRDAQPRPDVGECSLPPPKRKALDSSTSE